MDWLKNTPTSANRVSRGRYPEGEGAYEGYYDAGELPGTSTIYLKEGETIESLRKKLGRDMYVGDNVLVVVGDGIEDGFDPNEAIISNARF